MNSLYLLQFACLIFMLTNAFVLGIARLQVRWINQRYERSRWMLFTAMLGMAVQYFVQMFFGFRAMNDDLGAIINIIAYTPCFSLISMGIYNIEATQQNSRKMVMILCSFYLAIIVAFLLGMYSSHGNMRIGIWLYVMLALFGLSVVHCICMISREMIRRRRMLDYPDYSNDIISSECGFSSRTHLYRIFKLRVGCTPTEWRTQQQKKEETVS